MLAPWFVPHWVIPKLSIQFVSEQNDDDSGGSGGDDDDNKDYTLFKSI